MPDSERLLKHLEFVHNTINRMAGNSLVLKGWGVTLSTVLFALGAKELSWGLCLIGLPPALAFWGLDAFYLRQESLFRQLYDDLCNEDQRGDDEVNVPSFSMSTEKYRSQVDGWTATLFSKSVVGFHGFIVGTLLVLTLVVGLMARYRGDN